MTPQEHNRLISIFFHVQGGLQILGGLLMVLIYAGVGGFFLAASTKEQDQFLGGIFLGVAVLVFVLVLIFAALDFFAAVKIGKMQPIGRTLGIVLGILSLLSFPVGTALGVYALWFFFGDQGKALYGVDRTSGPYTSAPPPNSWQ